MTVGFTDPGKSGTGLKVAINVDLHHNGLFISPGDQNFATGTVNIGSQTNITLPVLQPGTYLIEAVVTDATNHQWIAENTIDVVTSSTNTKALTFEPNVGQVNSSAVKFVSQGSSYNAYLTATGLTLELMPASAGGPYAAFQMALQGANANAAVTGLNKLTSTSSYFVGDNPSGWYKDVANYGSVQYQNIYQNINLIYSGRKAS